MRHWKYSSSTCQMFRLSSSRLFSSWLNCATLLTRNASTTSPVSVSCIISIYIICFTQRESQLLGGLPMAQAFALKQHHHHHTQKRLGQLPEFWLVKPKFERGVPLFYNLPHKKCWGRRCTLIVKVGVVAADSCVKSWCTHLQLNYSELLQ